MLHAKLNSQYNVAKPDSLSVRIAAHQRKRMYARFLADCGVSERHTILDIGATSDRTYEASNYLEAWYPHKDMVTAVGIDDASFLEELYPGVKFICANGLGLPFEDKSFDIVHSSAVLEHVGSFENQVRFLKECTRVARVAVFVTTPNRWFPIEYHSVLPFIHWLPKLWFRSLMRILGHEFLSKEENLNLLSDQDIQRMIAEIPGCLFEVSSVPLCGWPSNLLLVGRIGGYFK